LGHKKFNKSISLYKMGHYGKVGHFASVTFDNLENGQRNNGFIIKISRQGGTRRAKGEE